MEAVINKTRGEILEGISAEEIDLLIKLVARLEHNIIELQSQGWNDEMTCGQSLTTREFD